MKRYVLGVSVMLLFGCELTPTDRMIEQHKININETLDAWHKAAADADFDAYFSYFDSDTSVFMGTDATERWTTEEFRNFSRPYFERGRAWNFTPVSRNVYVSKLGYTAWFDEQLDTPNLGPARGSGALVFHKKGWKIAQYNLTVPIPNAIMDNVKKQIEQVLDGEF